ncbi:MAG: oxygen-independent coproporphyrinogen III oxidase [Pseudomonadota bacterium]|nr:oxygen-independent coproporphyrinogen III oxidase [Pseudomonadota bacterium]
MEQTLLFDPDLLRKYDVRGPRYTSYPTAPQFTRLVDEQVYRAMASNAGNRTDALSLYVHIPFCRTVCFYCGCNKIVTANYRRAEDYLEKLTGEMALQAQWFGQREVTQLHFGGGTPTYLADSDLERVFAGLKEHFNLSRRVEREFSIEIDPRTVSSEKIALLGHLGFNRMSLGVQDFDPAVQQAVNRIQSVEQTEAALLAARASGFHSTSVDLIYGLPKQTLESFGRTLDTVIGLRPERLAVYSYAHMPALFKVQKQIKAEDLPDAETKLKLLGLTIERLSEAGYVYIGMDHFARPDDELALAQRQGTLQRNFQGYSTHAELDLVGLGVSAIGKIGAIYAQNAKQPDAYGEAIDQGHLAIVHGLRLSADDLLRRDLIQMLMCRGEIDIRELETRHGIDFSAYFGDELERLAPLIEDALLVTTDDRLQVTPRGRLLLRNVAMVFDAYLRPADRDRFSRAI